MNDKPEAPSPSTPDLEAAVRRARTENAERTEAIADLREIEIGRLALLESALKPVVRELPPNVDMFDMALAQGERPRLFIDMVSFVDVGHDRRTYRFFQDTLYGRLLIAESRQIECIVDAVTNYVARRLVEREKTLAAGRPLGQEQGPPAWSTRPPEAAEPGPSTPAAPPVASASSTARHVKGHRRGVGRLLAEALSFILMTLGSITLIGLLGIGLYLVWTARLRDLWVYWVRSPPF
ncbi:MAG TPA: hypothetical protein VMI72_05030 [Roseiarcus sp.]|nr:hypothetical protein [Roseiarcus sp.]